MLQRNASVRPSTQPAGTDWAAHEFALAPLPDPRLVARLITMATDFALQPTASLPQACGSWAKTKAAYRFFDHDGIAPEDLLAAHVQATARRAAAHPIVLCVQDTTSLNYSTHPQTKGLGPIGNNRDKTIGLFLHATLALTPAGQPWVCSMPGAGSVRQKPLAAPLWSATARRAPRRKVRSGSRASPPARRWPRSVRTPRWSTWRTGRATCTTCSPQPWPRPTG